MKDDLKERVGWDKIFAFHLYKLSQSRGSGCVWGGTEGGCIGSRSKGYGVTGLPSTRERTS